MARRSQTPRLQQALWIAAGVVVLTVLVIVLSWLTAGGEPATDPERAPAAPVATTQVEHPTFVPESPQGSRTEPAPLPPTPSVAVEELPKQEPETPPAVASTPEPTTPSAAAPASAPPSSPPPPQASPAPGGFGVQVGAFGSAASVREMTAKLERLGYKVATRPKGNLTRVLAVGYPSRAAAEAALQKLRSQGLATAQVVPLE